MTLGAVLGRSGGIDPYEGGDRGEHLGAYGIALARGFESIEAPQCRWVATTDDLSEEILSLIEGAVEKGVRRLQQEAERLQSETEAERRRPALAAT